MKNICRGITLRGKQCKLVVQNNYCSYHRQEIKNTKMYNNSNDKYSLECLITRFNQKKNDLLFDKLFSKQYGISLRNNGLPEDISENIIKFILYMRGDKTVKWLPGCDLISKIDGCIECKSFSSKGPISFSPTSSWDILYILDATEWLDEKFILWKCELPKDKWTIVKVNNTQTFIDQCIQGRRPRIGWSKLHSQITVYCTNIFQGTFTDICNGNKK